MSAPSQAAVGSATRTFPISVGDASEVLRELAEPFVLGDRAKALIDRASRRAGLTYWRAFDLWYGKARRLEAFEAEALAAALAAKREQEARNELHELRIRLARLEALLAQGNTDFLRAAPRSGERPAGGLGRMAGAVAAKA